jgi:hypothetical protein
MSHDLKGVERTRAIIRGAALSIIRQVLEKPDFDKARSGEVRRDWLAPPPLSAFQRLEPMGFGLTDEENWWCFNPYDCPPDLVWPLDVGLITEEGGTDPPGLVMSRTYTITPKQARGYAHRFGPFMVRSDHAQMERGQLMRTAALYVWLGGQWSDASNRVMWEGTADKPLHTRAGALPQRDRMQPALHTSMGLRQRYEWAVALGLDNSPSIRFATDPTGIKEVFRIRDLPAGRDRREALLNWVTQHWRQDRRDSDVEVYVRKHLRGATAFNWRGMNCELLPSQFDIDKRDQLKAEREAMHVVGTDRRQRA